MSENEAVERLNLALQTERNSAASDDRNAAWRMVEAGARDQPEQMLSAMLDALRECINTEELDLGELIATKALSLDHDHPELELFLAERYAARGLHPQALALMKGQVARGALSPRAERIMGLSSWRLGQMDQARAAFFRLSSLVQSGEANWPEARTTVEFFKAESDRPTLRMLLESLSERKSDDPELCLWMAEWLIEDLDEPRAREWLERALSLADSGSDLASRIWRVQFALSHPEDAESYRKTTIGIFHKSPEESRRVLEDILSRHPEFTEARFYLGTCYRRQGRAQDAVSCFEAVVAEQPTPNACLELGALYGELGRPAEALATSLQADELFEHTNHVAVCNIAAAHLELGDLEACRAALARAKEMRSEFPAIKRIEHMMEHPPEPPKRGCLGRLLPW